MSINPLEHYSIANPACAYDEDSLTVLELCSRLAAKVNELVKVTNNVTGTIFDTVAEWLEENGNPLNYATPQMFGAVGDGLADDTTAILTAIAVGRDVLIPEGVYKVSETLNIPGAQRIYGTGPNTIIKSSADVVVKTNTAGAVIENLRIDGNGLNTGVAVYKNEQTIQAVSLTNLAVGVKNANSDYVGSVRLIQVKFDGVGVCFSSAVLTNGVSFENCIAYRFDKFVEGYWMEAVSFDNCFMEKPNDNAVVLGLPANKTTMYCWSVNFHGCYIENVPQFIDGVAGGSVNLDGCWLYNVNYAAAATGGTKFIFKGCTFGVADSTSRNNVLFNFNANQVVHIQACTGHINNTGVFNLSDNNFNGAGVVFVDEALTNSGGETELVDHEHSASEITTGVLDAKHLPVVPVTKGGTGLSSVTNGNILVGGADVVSQLTPEQTREHIGAAPASLADEVSAMAENMTLLLGVGVVEKGTSGIWEYIKYENGLAICWGTAEYEATQMVAWGSSFEAGNGAFIAPAYPFTFSKKPVCMASLSTTSSWAGWLSADGTQFNGHNPLTTATPYNVMRSTSTGSGMIAPHIEYLVVGLWK